MAKKIKIAIRLDDICSTMNWVNFNKVITACDKYNVKPLLGVVPANEDKNLMVNQDNKSFWDEMLKLQDNGYNFAQHGYDHVYRNKKGGILKLNKKSEFVGQPKEVQKSYYAKGLDILTKNGLKIDTFMAPSNSFDKNTLLALKDIGIKYITDGYTDFNYKYCGLTFVPCMNAYAVKSKQKGIVTLCLHINTMTEDKFNIFLKTLEENKDNLIDFNDVKEIKPKMFFRIKQFFNLFVLKCKIVLKKILKRG